jgi:translocation and assembly module TamB
LGDSFRVVGAGLNSAWKGTLQLGLSGDRYGLSGHIMSKHGDFRVLGRPFRLAESNIHMDGASPIDPVLDLTAVHRRSGIEARVHITGRASLPVVTLESIPPLPEDTILATILFGRDLGTITPMQALQLAAAIKSLRQPGGGIDVFGRTRQLLGVDYIQFEKQGDQSESMSVAIGKYLHPDVYVEVQQPVNHQGQASAHVEYEVRPNLSLETDAGPGIHPGLGINWKKDY